MSESEMPEPRVLLDVGADGVAHVQMNRPDKKNALDAGLFEGLRDAALRVQHDASIRVVVLSGRGDCFCAGLDFATFGEMADGGLDAESEDIRAAGADLSAGGANSAQQIAWLWQEIPQPVIAAVQGAAYGGGFHIALGADIRLIAPDARIAFVEITWGLVPDLSGTQGLRRCNVPLDVAKRMILSGEPISGRQAVAWNLGTELSEDPIAEALRLARLIAGRSPDAVRAAKALLNESRQVSVAEGLANEFKASTSLMGGPNQLEAVVARLQTREPRFSDPQGAA
jgi:enoyl-CoA hydratase/carnithine racemase